MAIRTIFTEGNGPPENTVNFLVPSRDGLEIMKAVAKGDRSQKTLAALARVARTDPAYFKSCTPEPIALEKTVKATYGEDNTIAPMVMQEKLNLMKEQLAGTNATPLEMLLIDRIVYCYAFLYKIECSYASQFVESCDLDEFYQRRISRAHRRYLDSIKALASVRRLDLKSLTLALANVNVDLSQNEHPREKS